MNQHRKILVAISAFTVMSAVTITVWANELRIFGKELSYSSLMRQKSINSSGINEIGEYGSPQRLVEATRPKEETAEQGAMQIEAAVNLKLIHNSIDMELVLLPEGEFQMGSADRGAYHDEQPVHRVRISQPFYIGKYEVTQRQWQVVMEQNPSRSADNPERPVENVSWHDAQEFLRRLNAREGGELYCLPTEAQWEYAARARAITAYSFNDKVEQLGEYAWYLVNAEFSTHPVGQKRPNGWGLYDMHGNVWEWVRDWYGPYTAEETTDPTGPAKGSSRVKRGGAFQSEPKFLRSAARIGSSPERRRDNTGFRVVRGSCRQP